MVVTRNALPRVAPWIPMRRINLRTVHLATSIPSRFSCFHTFLTPYT